MVWGATRFALVGGIRLAIIGIKSNSHCQSHE